MAGHGGPDLVQDGLVLSLDAASKNSYPGSGTTWTDIVGSVECTLTNGPTFDSGNGGSIVFDGVNEYAQCGDVTSLAFVPTGGSDLSFAGWFYMDSDVPPLATILNYRKSDYSYTIWCNSKRPTAEFAYHGPGPTRAGIRSSGGALSADRWYHIVVTCDTSGYSDGKGASFIEMYIDGVDVTPASENNSPGLQGTDVKFQIGYPGIGGGSYWEGKLTNIAAWTRILTATEISQNFNAQRSRFGV